MLEPPSSDAPKAEWRKWAKARRARLEDVSSAVEKHLCLFLRERHVNRVLSYHAFGSEVSLERLPALLPGVAFYAPRAHFTPEPHLTLHPWDAPTLDSQLGMLEPHPDAPEVPLERVQAVLLPGLAFDAQGCRLGYGMGFYDRLLERLPGGVLTVGVCAGALIVPRLPSETHDRAVGFLALEAGVVRVG